jgi:sec-independent protein translocase protein TatB
MFNVGGGELLVIVLIALVVLGPQRLPDAMRTVGRVMGEVKRISSGFQQEITDAISDMDRDATPRPRREAVPLAGAVAAADADAAARVPESPGDGADADADDADDDEVVTGTVTSPWEVHDGVGTVGDTDGEPADATLAPAVADALDEIVTPLTPAPGDEAGSSGPAVGDERAAS